MPVNTGDPIGVDARFVLRASESLNELVTGTVHGGASGSTTSTSGGLAFVPGTSTTTWTFLEDELDPYVSGDFTLHWYGSLRDDTAQVLLQSVGASYGWIFGSASYAPGWLSLYLYGPWGGGAKYSDVTVITDDSMHCITVRYKNATTNAEFFLDGVALGSGTYTKDPGAMGAGQVFGIYGHATKPHKCVTQQAFVGALSDAKIATLVADPFTIFSAAPVTLVGANSTQGNLSGTGAIGIVGILAGAACVQGNAGGVGQITRTQTLTGSNCTQPNLSGTGSIDPYSRLRGLLRPVAKYEWTQVNTTRFLDCAVPHAYDNPAYTSLTHEAVLKAWPGFAVDRDNGNVIVWGGGHANYGGNEIYIWDGLTGAWGLGSLPSLVDSDGYIPGKSAPQSSHTYSNNVWLSVNKMFVTFGGAAAPSGGPFTEIVTPGTPPTNRRVGPWAFDLALANPALVGGATGSGWDALKVGSNAWYNRIDMVDGTYPIATLNHIGCRTIAVVEGGKDVCYFTMDAASGFPNYYRYEFGDIRAGGRDSCAKVGETWTSVVYDGFGVYDSSRGFMYSNSVQAGSGAYTSELSIQRVLGMSGTTHDTAIQLVDTVGAPFVMVRAGYSFGGAYNENDDLIYMWNGMETNPGTFYTVAIPAWDISTGWASTTWVVTEHTPSGSTPRGNFQVSVLGRMRYVPALKAVVVVDSVIVGSDLDAGVWMLKTTNAEYDLVGAGSTQGNVSGTGGITRTQTLTGANCSQANTCSTGSIAAAPIDLICAPSVQDNIATSSAIVQAQMVAAANCTQSHISSSGSIFLGDITLISAHRVGTKFQSVKSVHVRF
jgi:hypothetical protein